MPHPLQNHLKLRLTAGPGEVLQTLLKVFVNNPESYDEVIMLNTRLEKLRTDIRKGKVNRADENQELSAINAAALELINAITESEASAYELEQAIFKRILVVCKSAEREDYMRRLFPERYYKGVEFDISERPRPAASVNKFDLVVFDNSPHGGPEDKHELLLYYLTETEPYLLYFGQQFNLLWQYPEKAYFANSVFSIHARLEEMMGYLRYTKS